MDKQDIAKKINEALKEYFSLPSSPKKVKAKSLMRSFMDKGIFPSNHRDGSPLRKYLRKLDDNNMLDLIPYVWVERKDSNRYWFFVDISSTHSAKPVDDKSEITIKRQTSSGTHRRGSSDEFYIIDLCDKILHQKASRQHKFDFLVGDTGHRLPVDAYYEELKLVVEYQEYPGINNVVFTIKDVSMYYLNMALTLLSSIIQILELPKNLNEMSNPI